MRRRKRSGTEIILALLKVVGETSELECRGGVLGSPHRSP